MMQPTPPEYAPPAITVLDKSLDLMPKLIKRQSALAKQISSLQLKILDDARSKHDDVSKQIITLRAQYDAALARVRESEQQPQRRQQQHKQLSVSEASRSSHQRSRSPLPVGLVRPVSPEEQTKKLAAKQQVWPKGARQK